MDGKKIHCRSGRGEDFSRWKQNRINSHRVYGRHTRTNAKFSKMKPLFICVLFAAVIVFLVECKKESFEQNTVQGNWYLPQVRPETLYLYEFTGQTMTRTRFNNGTQDETLIRPYQQDADTVSVEDIYDLPVRKWLVQQVGDSAVFTDITPNAPYGVDYTLIKY